MERIAADCFNNPFTTDTGKPSKNMPYLDGIDNEDTVFTCQILNYSSSSPCNSEISTISDITITTALTTAIYHMASKKIQLEGGRYNYRRASETFQVRWLIYGRQVGGRYSNLG